MMKPKLILCLALVLSGVLALLGFNHFFWSGIANRQWTQTLERKLPSGEKLIEEIHLKGGFPKDTAKSSTLFIQWNNGERESLSTATQYPFVHPMNHAALSTNGDVLVIGAGRTVFYRRKTSPPNQWSSWTLTASPEIFIFVKNSLDAQSPNSYAFETNESTPLGAFTIKCNHLGVEQRIIIAAQGDLPYEVNVVRNEGRELVIVPFAPNPFAPRLVVSQDGDFGGWKFDERLTAIENERTP
jgi:hypothetical protein